MDVKAALGIAFSDTRVEDPPEGPRPDRKGASALLVVPPSAMAAADAVMLLRKKFSFVFSFMNAPLSRCLWLAIIPHWLLPLRLNDIHNLLLRTSVESLEPTDANHTGRRNE